ncbi:helix-turn-helix transcriptional regulator [Lactococcus sp. DD01]|uniref:helix-turn-helix transcriptional regulator n=1 Tax=Lactococcus sp. DD01 TaxID=1776443 RepID=UPI0007761BA0|nr:helix-turn-helix transcriptional regulator [Lactococcus sp. DD01]KXT63195.1 hypothetical protein LACDD01_00139 [Lactococcus sp. DD01]
MNISLKEAREFKGLTQKEVAKKVGIAVRSYQSYELETRVPSIYTAQKIAIALGVGAKNVHKLFPLV